jgi:hypothetical protein
MLGMFLFKGGAIGRCPIEGAAFEAAASPIFGALEGVE